MKKAISLLLAAVMVVGLLAGCGSSSSSSAPASAAPAQSAAAPAEAAAAPAATGAKAKDTITMIINAEPETLDPVSANSDAICIVLNFICENLFEMNADGTYVTELLESYEFVDDTTLKCVLKPGHCFSTGEELKASDVMWHLSRLVVAPKSASNFKFVNIDESTVDGDYEFTLKFNQAWAPWMNNFASGRGSVSSEAYFSQVGDAEFGLCPIGTGPYKIVKWEPGVQIELTRNEYYWGEPAATENIIIKFISESNSRAIELETGAADISFYIESTDVKRIDTLDGYHIVQGPAYRYFVVTLSMQEPLFQDERVRWAMSYAINKAALVEMTSDGVGEAINGYCPTCMLGYMDEPEIPYDVEKAKSLMAEAGYADGFEIEIHCPPETIYTRAAEVLQSFWSEIGITSNIVSESLATYEANHNGKFQVSLRDGTASEISNVFVIYESSFGSRIQGNDPVLDQMLLDLRTYYYDDPQRDVFLKEVTDYIYNMRFSYPYMVMPTIVGVSDKLEGYEYHPADDHHTDFVNWVVYE